MNCVVIDYDVKQALLVAGLLDYFENLAASHQKEYLNWILEAKKVDTKQKRITKTIEMLKSKKLADAIKDKQNNARIK
jgi:uncharacterized protein YdeI (YjbR/CyaY-like superfamily)